MHEYKGKCEWGATWIVIGAVALFFTAYFCVLFGIGGRNGLVGGLLIAILVGAFFGGASITVILLGISRMIYSHEKIVLRVYDNCIEFISRNKFFNKTWQIAKYSDIVGFSVLKFEHNEAIGKLNEKEAGTIEFKLSKEGKSILIDVEHCLEASELIKLHLEPKQIEGYKRTRNAKLK